jgi:S-DNA-T family DNA segregation ATPase FtsK/SpoIIIE
MTKRAGKRRSGADTPRTTRGRSRRDTGQTEAPPRTAKILWLLGAGAWLLLAMALVSFDAADSPTHAAAIPNEPPSNWLGQFGALVSYGSVLTLGSGMWVVLAVSGGALVLLARGERITHPAVRAAGALLLVLAVGGLHAVWMPEVGRLPGAKGGIVPLFIASELLPRFGAAGTSLILLVALGIGAVVTADRLVSAAWTMVLRGLRSLDALRGIEWPKLRWPLRRPALATSAGAAIAADRESTRRRWAPPAAKQDEAEEAEEEEEDEEEEALDDDEDAILDESEEEEEEEYEEDEDDEAEDACEEEEEEEEAPGSPAPLSEEALREKMAKLPVRIASSKRTVARDEDLPRPENFEGYQFPGLDLLEDPEDNFSQRMEAFVREQAQVLETSLRTFQIDAEVTGIESGPVVTLYSVQLAPGTRVARLQAIASDVARSLQAQNIRIIPNMVGKTTVGIEVPNRQKEKVRLKELMSGGQAGGMHLPMFLGKDASGEPLVLDLARMPHMLIAGTTGSGKSVCINTIIMGWLYTRRPDELKLVLVDPKMVELSLFSDIPHLMCPVVTEMGRAAAILEWAVDKMEERYELLKEAGVRDIASYNALGEEELVDRLQPANDLERARIPKKLPYMVFVIDELADLIMTQREVEHFIVRIAQKARAVGIHLILATQRPQANVVTGLIKSNMPCRVAFKVASGMDSRIVLDSKGAELLLGQGDMLVLTPAGSELRRCQGTLVADSETRKVTRFLKQVAGPSFERSLVAIRGDRSAAGEGEGGDGAAFERDPLFEKAVEIIIESGRGSVSLLQRRLAIGYGRSSRLIDQMGLAGILGDHKGSVAREVLITLDDWKRMKELAEQDGDAGEDREDPDHAVGAAAGEGGRLDEA